MAGNPGQANAWIRRFHPLPEARVRLVCFPHAGGSASYYFPVSRALAEVADVLVLQYPGRQDRRAEPCIEDTDELADAVTVALRERLDLPTVLFGHSMGATLAFEVARRLERDGIAFSGLVVSGRRAPAQLGREQVHTASESQLISHVKKLSGTDAGVLADPDILRMILPAIRSDYKAAETYRYRPGRPLSCPLFVLTGDDDPQVTPTEAEQWRDYTTGDFALEVFEGGHFYFSTAPDKPLAHLAECVAALTPPVARAS